MSVSKSPRPMWNEYDDQPDEVCRDIEDQVQMRSRAKRLQDCELPDGFRLVTPNPRQFWIQHQMTLGFCLAWQGVHVEFMYVARYSPQIRDEVQMEWALDEFTRELVEAGMNPKDVRKELKPEQIAVVIPIMDARRRHMGRAL